MAPDPAFFRDFAYVLVAAVLGAVLAWLTRQPLIIGYVVGGLLISPFTPGPSVSDLGTFELMAEFGVILLMFSIGIEFSLHELLRVKWIAIIGGPLGMLLSTGVGWAVGIMLGWPPLQGVVVGMVVSMASTMVLARLLMERGELRSSHGRIMIGITLVEDLAVVVLIVLIPRLEAFETDGLATLAVAVGQAALVLGPFLYLAAKVVPWVLMRVARTRSQELFLLVVLAIALGTAAVTQAVGLSLALGAFLAGLIISESAYAHETLARLLPLRDVFVALFFVTMGALIDPPALLANLPVLGVIVGHVLLANFAIWLVVVRLFGQPLHTALLVAVGLTQIGEFSFVLIKVAFGAGQVGDDVYNATLAASLITILINAFLCRHVPLWIAGIRVARAPQTPDGPPGVVLAGGHVVVCGFGRVGSAIAEAFEAFSVRYVAVEVDPDIVTGLRARRIPSLFGDASQRPILEAAEIGKAALVVVALPEIEQAHLTVSAVRELAPGVPILARAHDARGRERLAEAGATEVIQPELEAASTLIRHALRRLSLPRDRVLAYLDRYRDAMEAGPAAQPPASAPEDRRPEEALPVVREVTVDGNGLADQPLRALRLRERFGIMVVTITRADGEVLHHLTADTVLRRGDRAKVFGLPAQIDAFLQKSALASDTR